MPPSKTNSETDDTAHLLQSSIRPAYLSQIEAGSANPTVRTLSRLAIVLGTNLAWLFGNARTSEPLAPAGFGACHSPAALATRTAGGNGIRDLTLSIVLSEE